MYDKIHYNKKKKKKTCVSSALAGKFVTISTIWEA